MEVQKYKIQESSNARKKLDEIKSNLGEKKIQEKQDMK